MESFVLETKNLLKKYKEHVVIDQVNIHLRKGRIYGLLGRNGAGKTTIMKIILGLTNITSGEISVFGQNLKGNEKNIYPRIGSMIEKPSFYPNLTGMENLKVFSKLRGKISIDVVKKALDVVDLPYNDKKTFSQYSLGMKQRLGIANAIINDPELLILDEPINGLDPIGIARVRDFIRTLSRQGKTILISSHNLTEMGLMADDIGIIHKGVLLEESSYMELKKKNGNYIFLRVSSSSEAIRILEQQFGVSDYLIDSDNTIRIYETDRNPAELNYALTTNYIAVSALKVCNESLEDYFKKITGGVGIA